MKFLPDLPPELNMPAARLFVRGFHDKIRPIFGDAERSRRFVAANLDPRYCLAALSEQGLVGILGVQTQGDGFLNVKREAMVTEYGWIRGSIKFTIYHRLSQVDAADEWYVDGLVVAEGMRGQGIGTGLLDLFERTARERGATMVSLDVVDTNPRAKALYERHGFMATKETSIRPFNRVFRLPYAAMTRMIKPLTAQDEA